MENFCLKIWVIICFKHISNPGRIYVNNFIAHAWTTYNLLLDLTITLYQGNWPLKISSGTNFQTDWIIFENLLSKNLTNLDLKSSLKQKIELIPSKMIQFKLLSGLNDLLLSFNPSLEFSTTFLSKIFRRARNLQHYKKPKFRKLF